MATLLVVTILLPLLGGLGLLLAPRLDHTAARWIALATTLVTLVFSLVLVLAFQVEDPGAQFSYRGSDGHPGIPWVSIGSGSGIRFALGLDGVALSLFALTALLLVTSVFSSWSSIVERAPAYYALLLFLETGLLGLFASLDVILFYIFFEFTLIPLFFIVGIYGGPERRRASITFFLYTLAGSLLTLLGVIALVVVQHSYSDPNVLTFSIPELTEGLAKLSWTGWTDTLALSSTPTFVNFMLQPQVLIFLLLFAGFAIKVPLFPFHTWLPLAHVEAPTAGSVLLAGVLLKVGGYGFLRFNLGMTPEGAAVLAPFLVAISVIGIIYGALTALAQTDVKRLVAYSSVSHMGFIALGLFSMTLVSVDGAVLQMINHGLTTGALFACVGILYERYHTREMSRVGGVWERLPLFAFFLILASMGSAAVPGLNGFVGEFPILAGTFARFPTAAVIAAIGIILGAYYLFDMLQKVVFGPLVEPAGDGHGHLEEVPPIRWYEIAGLAPLLLLIVLIGIYPKPFYDRITPSVEAIVARFPDTDAKPIQTVSNPDGVVPSRALLAAPAQVIAP
jgi:NADH-quinone oxidoreductase subunit M